VHLNAVVGRSLVRRPVLADAGLDAGEQRPFSTRREVTFVDVLGPLEDELKLLGVTPPRCEQRVVRGGRVLPALDHRQLPLEPGPQRR
jgi:hypothetical protein